ncbi:MAG: UDP-glucose 4-epimerase [Dethiosulfovibrio peptidovorans]|nr:MAG: UDP-glucose 4-epimerase [Dethiosulfovibrio peptidovorans]
MKRIVVTGGLGQIGVELIRRLRQEYGTDLVLATDVKSQGADKLGQGPFELLDVRDGQALANVVKKHRANTVVHLAGILSANAEKNPQFAWAVNMNGLYNALEVARQENCSFFFPSSIAAFGPGTPSDKTPQDTIQRPNTIYGVAKVAGELLCDYYHHKYGLDTRGVRFPGLISYDTLPGGGTTDYAVHIYYDAVSKGRYTSFIAQGTYMDMMYMPDALNGVIQLMEADPKRLKHRCCFNITAMSFEPGELASAIAQHVPGFILDYAVDPKRQAYAESWPNSIDDSAAREEWDWNPKYDLETMTVDMLEKLQAKTKETD